MGRFLPLLLALSSFGAAPPARHWAFLPPYRAPVPLADGARNPLDAFHRARLKKAGLVPAPEASRLVLLRRVSFTLTGLPPEPDDPFLADERPDAWERLVDRLLASPAHGERWAQHWLDVARFAETNGYEADGERPQAWRYRDWVAEAFDRDMPYPDFIAAQVAGDLLAKGDRSLMIAAGFNRCGPIHQVSGNVDPLEIRHELLDEMTAGLGAAFLGVTLGCARCHDHKFDPVSQAEYFRMEAFFSRAKPAEIGLGGGGLDLAAHAATLAPIQAAIALIDAPVKSRLGKEKTAKLEPKYKEALAAKVRTAEQKRLAGEAATLTKVTWDEVLEALPADKRAERAALREKLHALRAAAPQPPSAAWTLVEEKGELSAHILKRGNIHRRAAKVAPGYPAALGAGKTGTRVELAKWLGSRTHPLTARVMANRLWQHHFGKGIVRTPNDFGTRGDPPTHPELLDWLAMEFMEDWSMKRLHRLIVGSAAYRQSWRADAPSERLDPGNRLLWRMDRRRLDGEALRDAVLSASGHLLRQRGGPSVRVPLEPEVYDLIFTEDEPDGLWLPTPDARQHGRRSLYLFNKRNVRLPQLEAFDQPDTLRSCEARPQSIYAPQALILLNGPFMQSQAGAMALRVMREGKGAERAYGLALGRLPTKEEAATAASFLEEQAAFLKERLRARKPVALPEGLPKGTDPAKAAALADLCLALLNRNGFVFIE